MPLGGLPLVGKQLLEKGYDQQTVLLIMDSWRPSTKKLYSTYVCKWLTYCVQNKVSVKSPTLPQVCKFLRVLAGRGLGYGALNAARCALATFLPHFEGYEFGKHPLVCRIIKGVYERNPPAPRYTSFWDVNRVFSMFKEWGRNADLSLKLLTLKLVMLLMLTTAQRGQTVMALSIDALEMTEIAVFRLKKLLKHNRLGEPLDSLVLRPFDECYRLCVVRALKCYVSRTKDKRRGETQLLVSFAPPYKAISRDTLARWVLTSLRMAGIDTSKYRSHSTRGATASAANRLGVPLRLILKQAGWKNQESFARFYNKDIDREQSTMGHRLLQAAT